MKQEPDPRGCWGDKRGAGLRRGGPGVLLSAPGRSRLLADPSIAAGQTEVLPSDLISRYRSVRGSPNCGRMLLSANQVMADIWSPSMVRTNSPNARATPVSGTGR